jgi:cellulose synthase/poly-beta-1,6-N-acetylglucosamine synthase-like glycosyltransferase
MEWVLVVIILGVNLLLWTLIGGLRFTSERLAEAPRTAAEGRLRSSDVAVLIPAHNEAPVIAATIRSALRLVPPDNVHVVADGCDDDTAEIARANGANVLELNPGRGKAGGIEAAVEHFDLPARFAVVLILDADTELDEHYLERGLPLLNRPGVVALAGYARAGWRPHELSPVGRFLIAYRTRLYAVMQWLKYGQTWRWTNVTSIVPGFASMYRTSVLRQMDLNPPGLVIEDFNMTFEIHHRRLGKIAFEPAVYATTQDPDNFNDYYRQVTRWHLGFWQTLRRHGFWFSGFSAALALFVTEVVAASLGLALLIASVVLVAPIVVASFVAPVFGWSIELGDVGDAAALVGVVLLFALAADYLLTILTAIAMRRPVLLLYGLGFLVLRFVDATAVLGTIPQAWRSRSDGRWTSPTRRPSTDSPQAATRGQPP